MSEQKTIEASPRYVHPLGEKFFSKGFFAVCGILAVLQTLFIPAIVEQGAGYEHLFTSMVAAHIYIYVRAWRLTRKSKQEPVNFYSLVSGYIIISCLLYVVPLVLAAGGEMAQAGNNVVDSILVENNREFLTWVLSLDLPGTPPPLDWMVHKNAVNIYYLTLAMFVLALGITLSIPLLWLMARGWSDYMDANPAKYTTSTKFYALLMGVGACAYLLPAAFRQISYGHSLLPNGSFAPFDNWSWNRDVISWFFLSFAYPVLFALSAGAALNLAKGRGKKSA